MKANWKNIESRQLSFRYFIKSFSVFMILSALLGPAAGCQPEESGPTYISHRDGKPSPGSKGALDYLDENFIARPGFSSHLPLLILEPASRNLNGPAEEGPAFLYLVDSSNPENRLGDPEPLKYEIALTLLGDEAQTDAKGSVGLKLAHGPHQGLLGLPPAGEWLLRGSSRDKGLLRNYLAYILGGEIMPKATPLARLCEVLVKRDDEFYYQGLYLLTQSVEDRLGLTDKKAGEGFLLKYEPGTVPGHIFKIRGDPTGAESGSISLVYPPSDGDWAQRPAIVAKLARAENYLYSNQPDLFFKYSSVLNVESFINTLILNGFLSNYLADGLPAYLYSEGGKLSLSPVWDFDQALDNTIEPLGAGQAGAERTLWLERLMNCEDFVKQYRRRYYQLYRGVLGPDRIGGLVAEADLYLRPAMLRDWARWRRLYTEDKRFTLQPGLDGEGLPLIRQTVSHNQELVKIRHNLHINDKTTRERLLELQWVPGLIDGAGQVKRDALMVALFLAVFFSLVIFTRKKIS